MSKIMLFKMAVYGVATLVLGLVIMQFLSVNQEVVSVETYFGPLSGLSIGRLLVLAFAIGGVTGFLMAFVPGLIDVVRVKRLRSQLNVQKHRVHELEKKEKAMLAHVDLPGEEG